jgi:hypothetical protein
MMSDEVDFVEPSCHSYLGDSLKDHNTRQVLQFNPEKIYRMLVIPLANVVLFPGETLPLRIQDPATIQWIQRNIEAVRSGDFSAQEGCLIGVLNKQVFHNSYGGFCTVGTVIEIRSSDMVSPNIRVRNAWYNNENDTSPEMVLTCKGVRRFTTMTGPRGMLGDVNSHGTSKIMRVMVLPEPAMHPYPFPSSAVTPADHMHSAVSYSKPSPFPYPLQCPLYPLHRTCTGAGFELGPFPDWVYAANSPSRLARRAYDAASRELQWKVQCIFMCMCMCMCLCVFCNKVCTSFAMFV